jgi:hypothetical protein
MSNKQEMNGNEIENSRNVSLYEDTNNFIDNFGDATKYLAENCERVRIYKSRYKDLIIEGDKCHLTYSERISPWEQQ